MKSFVKALFLSLLILAIASGCGGEKKAAHGGGHGGGEGKEGGGEPIYTFKEDFVVNLVREGAAEGTPNSYLKVKLGLLGSSDSVKEEIGASEYKVRDRINYILSRQTAKSVATDSGKDNIKKEIKEAVGKLLSEGEIKDVYFADFVSQ